MILSISNLWWQFLLLSIGSYLIGNINFAVIISKLKKQDIRKIGSGNPGTLNMSRNFGLKIGVLTLLLDILKGAIPTLAGLLLYKGYVFAGTTLPINMFAKVMCGFFAVLGHVFPVFMKFKGGKGLACLGGVVLMFDFRYFLLLLAAELVIALATDYICFVPITASVIFPVSYGILRGDVIGALILGISAVVMLAKHIENIKRMRKGEEMRLSYLWNKDKELGRITQNLKDDE